LLGQRVVQVAEMADAQARDLEHEDGIAMRDRTARPVADVGHHVAHAHIVVGEVVLDRARALAPALQYVLDVGVREVGVVRVVRPVHGGDVGHDLRPHVVIVVGGDGRACRALDQPGRVSNEGQAHFRLLQRDGLHQAGCLRDGEAAIRDLGAGRSAPHR
jgi:hypothetical protein